MIDPVVLNNYYTPVTTAFKTNDVNVFVNTVVVIKTVVQVDAFVQATVSVCNSGEAASFPVSSSCHANETASIRAAN